MTKHRIYEIANELDLESKEMLGILEELGMGDLTPLNTVDDEEYNLILELYEEEHKGTPAEEEEPAEEETEPETTEEVEEEETTEEKGEETFLKLFKGPFQRIFFV